MIGAEFQHLLIEDPKSKTFGTFGVKHNVFEIHSRVLYGHGCFSFYRPIRHIFFELIDKHLFLQTDINQKWGKTMSRIFITGDTHCDIDIHKLSTGAWPEQKNLTREDVLIIAGDFGAPWTHPEDKTDQYILKWHENKSYTTLFVDGNHENFDALAAYPETVFANAKCHVIRPHVLHVQRGEVLQLKGHRIWCMGGAISDDREFRRALVSWWSQEKPNESEWQYAFDTLQKSRPDIIITHETNEIAAYNFFHYPENNVSAHLNEALRIIWEQNLPVTDWYFGHHHTDFELEMHGIRYHAMYNKIAELK